jgi:hypothetical protein
LLLDLAYSKSFEKAAKKASTQLSFQPQSEEKELYLKIPCHSCMFPIDNEAKQNLTLTSPGEQLKDKVRMINYGMF